MIVDDLFIHAKNVSAVRRGGAEYTASYPLDCTLVASSDARAEPPSLPTTRGSYRPRLRALYDYRTDADDTARAISPTEAHDGITLVRESLALVSQAKGLSFAPS